jgi:hypothetical protein
LHRAVAHQRSALKAYDGVLVLIAALLALSASFGGQTYPLSGSRSAVAFVERSLTPNDAVLIEQVGSLYPYAAASRLHLIVRPQRRKVAFTPGFPDPRFHTIAFTGIRGNTLTLTTPSGADRTLDVARAVSGADRVFLFVAALRTLPVAGRLALDNVLKRARFEVQTDAQFHNAHVIVWRRLRA